jgi:hypothetical protein
MADTLTPPPSPRMKQKIDSELQPGESILWISRPIPTANTPGLLSRFLHPEDIFAITNRRAIRFYGNRFVLSAISYTPDRLQNIKYVERPDGSGDLIFVHYHSAKSATVDFGFLQVPNVREPDRVLIEVLHAKHMARST